MSRSQHVFRALFSRAPRVGRPDFSFYVCCWVFCGGGSSIAVVWVVYVDGIGTEYKGESESMFLISAEIETA